MSLISSINGERITTLSGAGTPASVPSTINGVGVGTTFDRDTVNLSAGLDSIAGSFSRSFIRFNEASTLLNVTESTVSGILEITNELVDIAEQAASTDLNDEQRARLNSDFVELRREIANLRSSAEIEGSDFLEKTDIENVLETAGIDLDKSSRVAEIFNRIGGNDGSLTIEQIIAEDVTVQENGSAQTAVAPNLIDPLSGLSLVNRANAQLTANVLREFQGEVEQDLEDIQGIREELSDYLQFARVATLVYEDAALGGVTDNNADSLAESLASQIRQLTRGQVSDAQTELDTRLVSEILSSE